MNNPDLNQPRVTVLESQVRSYIIEGHQFEMRTPTIDISDNKDAISQQWVDQQLTTENSRIINMRKVYQRRAQALGSAIATGSFIGIIMLGQDQDYSLGDYALTAGPVAAVVGGFGMLLASISIDESERRNVVTRSRINALQSYQQANFVQEQAGV